MIDIYFYHFHWYLFNYFDDEFSEYFEDNRKDRDSIFFNKSNIGYLIDIIDFMSIENEIISK
jgi:hypothetical protein